MNSHRTDSFPLGQSVWFAQLDKMQLQQLDNVLLGLHTRFAGLSFPFLAPLLLVLLNHNHFHWFLLVWYLQVHRLCPFFFGWETDERMNSGREVAR